VHPHRAKQGTGADCLQRPLRSRFQPQLRPGVRARDANQAMTYAPRANGSRCHLRCGSSGRRALSQTSVQRCRRRRRWAAAGVATRRGLVNISGTPEPPLGVRALTSHSSGRGGAALVQSSVVQAHVRGGFAPAAEPWALDGI
jgi:hypothetical protein